MLTARVETIWHRAPRALSDLEAGLLVEMAEVLGFELEEMLTRHLNNGPVRVMQRRWWIGDREIST